MTLRSVRAATVLIAAMILAVGCAASTDAHPSPAVSEDADFGTVQVYGISANATLTPQASGTASAMWNMFVKVVTTPVAESTFNSYRVGDSRDSSTLAYVSRDTEDPTQWMLVANAAYADDTDTLLQTLVHEYAHVLSLGVSQVPPASGTCTTLELSEGCATAESHIYAFQRAFWDAYGPSAPRSENDDSAVGDAFYAAHEEDFVSAYAASNVTEDFAESFAAFVRENKPDSQSPVAMKLRFFWDVPEYVAFRTHVRDTFGLI